MTFAEMTRRLRDTANAYGGGAHLRTAADRLDKANSAFFKAQTDDTLRALNGAYALAFKELAYVDSTTTKIPVEPFV